MSPRFPRRTGRAAPLAGCLLLVASALSPAGLVPLPPFVGPDLPEPPRQKEPWAPPATGLPKFLVAATATLAEQGLPDPRGCEYREVELPGEDQLPRNPRVPRPKTHAWVLPGRPEGGPRFAIAWNGLIYPLVAIGEPADLDADVPPPPGAGPGDPRPARGDFPGRDAAPHLLSASTRGREPIRACLLLRLGRADLAERAFAASTGWRPPGSARDLTSYGVSYLSIASDWAWALFERATAAHARRDDPQALLDSRELARVRPLVEARAAAMGFTVRTMDGNSPATLGFLKPLAGLLADQERRALRPADAAPALAVLEKIADQPARIAALIASLDEYRESSSFGGTYPIPAVAAIAREGQAALEPLIVALESDDRLTRAVRGDDRHGSRTRDIMPTLQLVHSAIVQILGTNQFTANANQSSFPYGAGPAERREVARSIRAYAERFRGVSEADRRYQILADDRASAAQWLGAGAWITAQPDPVMARLTPLYASRTKDRLDAKAPRRGDPLRDRKSPSVSSLLARRAEGLSRDPNLSRSMDAAKNLAIDLAYWDPEVARPVLRTLARRCNDLIAGKLPENFGGQAGDEAASLAEITSVRVLLGDAGALADYAESIARLGPEKVRDRPDVILRPMTDHPADPAVVRAAEAMFLGTGSPWLPLLGGEKRPNAWYGLDRLLGGPLVGVAPFRALLVRTLGDRTPFGFARLDEGGQAMYRIGDGGSGGASPAFVDPDGPKSIPEIPMRACDYLAWQLTLALDGIPPLMPYWPEDRRDRAIAAQVAHLERYGDRYAESPAREGLPNRLGMRRREPAFPPLDRPATLDEVRRGLAIFSLEGRGPARVVPMPARPVAAKWATLRDYAFPQQSFDPRTGKAETKIAYDQDGLAWQAEEVEEGGRWRRYYGFAGRRLDRVPAEEVEFPEPWYAWSPLAGQVDARLAPVGGQPRTFVLRLRNRAGLPREVPAAFLAPGRPALRPGVALALSYTPGQVRPGFAVQEDPATKWEDLPPKSTARLDPDPATRPLAPAESFDAFTIRLDDWFDTSRPGTYRLVVRFAADSGLGEGASNAEFVPIPEPTAPEPGAP